MRSGDGPVIVRTGTCHTPAQVAGTILERRLARPRPLDFLSCPPDQIRLCFCFVLMSAWEIHELVAGDHAAAGIMILFTI